MQYIFFNEELKNYKLILDKKEYIIHDFVLKSIDYFHSYLSFVNSKNYSSEDTENKYIIDMNKTLSGISSDYNFDFVRVCHIFKYMIIKTYSLVNTTYKKEEFIINESDIPIIDTLFNYFLFPEEVISVIAKNNLFVCQKYFDIKIGDSGKSTYEIILFVNNMMKNIPHNYDDKINKFLDIYIFILKNNSIFKAKSGYNFLKTTITKIDEFLLQLRHYDKFIFIVLKYCLLDHL